jgi:hypothetical protein
MQQQQNKVNNAANSDIICNAGGYDDNVRFSRGWKETVSSLNAYTNSIFSGMP